MKTATVKIRARVVHARPVSQLRNPHRSKIPTPRFTGHELMKRIGEAGRRKGLPCVLTMAEMFRP